MDDKLPREVVALVALHGLLSNYGSNMTPTVAVKDAFNIADAFMAEAEKRKT